MNMNTYRIQQGLACGILLGISVWSMPLHAQTSIAESAPIYRVDTAVQAFMDRYEVPGLSLAITKDEKLVYVKSYGYSDKEAEEKLLPAALFRIASISKTITATAIFKLIEEGKLRLDDTVFGTKGILGTHYGTKPYSLDIQKITIRHLLQHTAGGWGNSNGDPMFVDASWTMEHLINSTLDNKPLEHEPGKVYVYSNFGYCLLGRVIEAITGQSYEYYIVQSVLRRMGIKDMLIGGNTREARLKNEVIYYGRKQGGLHPYIYNIRRMDAHGGWLATATDLMRFIVHIDGFDAVPDILKKSTIQLMTTISTAEENTTYAYGWRVIKEKKWWHSGSLPGTGTHMTRLPNGFSWTALTNTRISGQDYYVYLEKLLDEIASDETMVWPDVDLF